MTLRKRQVMSPTMALVPMRPFTFSQLLQVQLLLPLLVLGLLTGTVNVPTLLSQLTSHFAIDLRQGLSPFLPPLFSHAPLLLTAVSMVRACITLQSSLLSSLLS